MTAPQEAPVRAVVYGDHQTVAEMREQVLSAAGGQGLKVAGWHSDPDGLRLLDRPGEAAGLVAALGDCVRQGAALFVPYPVDLRSEASARLIGHWLHSRGLRLFVGRAEYLWDSPADPVEWSLRHLLDASTDLAVAVIASGGTEPLEKLLEAIVGEDGPVAGAGTCSTLERVRKKARLERKRGEIVPPEPDPEAPWPLRRSQCASFAVWLRTYTTLAGVAKIMDDMGVRGRSGNLWTAAGIGRLVRSAASEMIQASAGGEGTRAA